MAAALWIGALICVFLANYHYLLLQYEVNERLPEGEKFEPLFWSITTHQKLKQLQRRVLPESKRPAQALRWTIAGFCLMGASLITVLVINTATG